MVANVPCYATNIKERPTVRSEEIETRLIKRSEVYFYRDKLKRVVEMMLSGTSSGIASSSSSSSSSSLIDG